VDQLADLAAERMVLAGVSHSGDAFLDVDYQLTSNTFTDETNQVIYSCIKSIRDENAETVIDLTLLRSKAKELGLSHIVENPEELKYIRQVLASSVEISNVRRFAAVIRKLEIARLLYDNLEESKRQISAIKGNESIDAIISLVENRLFDFTSLLIGEGDAGIVHISDGALEYFQYLCENVCEIVGIPSGYHHWDEALGGLRRKTVNMVGARSGIGKSMMADNIALYVGDQDGQKKPIPVLYLDTEMAKDGHWHRIWANISDVPSKLIETGKFSLNEFKKEKVFEAVKHLNGLPYYYVNIAGKPFEETLSYMRRWIIKHVGYDENGRVNDCLIIYDYLKLMDSASLRGDLKEFQVLGFQMTGLHNFAVKFDVPILSFVQLNRDGIDKETTDVISQSDRIVWLASSLSLLRPKSDDEMAASANEGDYKLVVLKSRYGAAHRFHEYINMKFNGSIGRIQEGRLSSQVPTFAIDTSSSKKRKNKQGEFEVNHDAAAEPVPFT
jgi:replicative DNA helicase